jgi:hypothetical protein
VSAIYLNLFAYTLAVDGATPDDTSRHTEGANFTSPVCAHRHYAHLMETGIEYDSSFDGICHGMWGLEAMGTVVILLSNTVVIQFAVSCTLILSTVITCIRIRTIKCTALLFLRCDCSASTGNRADKSVRTNVGSIWRRSLGPERASFRPIHPQRIGEGPYCQLHR